MQRFCVGICDCEEPVPGEDLAIIGAGDEDEAVRQLLEPFAVNALEIGNWPRLINCIIAPIRIFRWGEKNDNARIRQQFKDEGETSIVENRIIDFFEREPEYGDIFLEAWEDESELEQDEFPDDMQLFVALECCFRDEGHFVYPCDELMLKNEDENNDDMVEYCVGTFLDGEPDPGYSLAIIEARDSEDAVRKLICHRAALDLEKIDLSAETIDIREYADAIFGFIISVCLFGKWDSAIDPHQPRRSEQLELIHSNIDWFFEGNEEWQNIFLSEWERDDTLTQCIFPKEMIEYIVHRENELSYGYFAYPVEELEAD